MRELRFGVVDRTPMLTKTDRRILAMKRRKLTLREIAARLTLSPAWVHERLARLSELYEQMQSD
jgi:DNA-binding Lrp family transcriptional regulator